jgi:hypothetical protein
MALSLLDGGGGKPKPDYSNIYLNALIRKNEAFVDNPKDKELIKQLIFYGVKFINSTLNKKLSDYESIERRFKIISSIKTFISALTPNELLTVFPLDKTYDGKRYETKDYFFSIKELKKIGLDNQIGDNVEEMLWDYMNMQIHIFLAESFSVLSDLRKFEGHQDLLLEFFEKQGIPLTTYSMFKEKGKQYMRNNATGEIKRVRKRYPRYLRPITP